MNHRDIYMMRAWFHLERNSGYSLPEAKQNLGIDKRRATEILKEALADYLESLWIGRGSELDRTKQIEWFENTAAALYRTLGTDIEPLFSFLESLPDVKHDVDQEAGLLLVEPLRQIPNSLDATLRTRVLGLFSRSIGKLNKAVQKNKSMTGLQAVVEELDAIRRTIEQRAKS